MEINYGGPLYQVIINQMANDGIPLILEVHLLIKREFVKSLKMWDNLTMSRIKEITKYLKELGIK